MKYYKRCENHFYFPNIQFSESNGDERGLPMTNEKKEKNHEEKLENYEATLILVVKDDFSICC